MIDAEWHACSGHVLRVVCVQESENKLPELSSQISMKEKMERLNALKTEVESMKESRIQYIQNSAKEIDRLRQIIRNLNLAGE